MATFHLQIVTPDRMVFDGQAERVIVRTAGGDVCILPRHIDRRAPRASQIGVRPAARNIQRHDRRD